MNEITQAASWISILMIAVLAFWLFPDYWVDSFRQKMFYQRDRLFDDARNGRIAFDHPAHIFVRTTMNGFIRFAHRINLPMVLSVSATLHASGMYPKQTFKARFESLSEDLAPEARELVNSHVLEMNQLLAVHAFKNSPLIFFLLFVTVVPLLVLLAFMLVARGMLIRTISALGQSQVDRMDTLAFVEGSASTC